MPAYFDLKCRSEPQPREVVCSDRRHLPWDCVLRAKVMLPNPVRDNPRTGAKAGNRGNDHDTPETRLTS